MRPCPSLFLCALLLGLVALVPAPPAAAAGGEDATGKALDAATPPAAESRPPEQRFQIKRFDVGGTRLYSPEVLSWTLHAFTGPDRTVADVEAARDYLNREFERVGYPTLRAYIPEQTIQNGIVKLEIAENTVGEVRVVGNKHYSDAWLKGQIPELRVGKPLYAPGVDKGLARLNRNPEHEVRPVLVEGKQPGTTDVELKVKDRSPWGGRVELNNDSTLGTPELRTVTEVKYKNLWDREHVLTAAWTTSPQDFRAVNDILVSYVWPIHRWNDSLAVYADYSDSTSLFGVPGLPTQILLGNVGKQLTIGVHYTATLFDIGNYRHQLVLGVDYKKSDQSQLAAFGSAPLELLAKSPIQYLPFSVAYSGQLDDRHGSTKLWGNVYFNVANILPMDDDRSFQQRLGYSANYIYAKLGAERTQALWRDWKAYLEFDGQVTPKPLIDLEFFKAGGANSVRGFRDQALQGDEGFHGTAELWTPFVPTGLPKKAKVKLRFLGFFDYARVIFLTKSGKIDTEESIQSVGAGVRFSLYDRLNVAFDYGWPIELSRDQASLDPGFSGRGSLRVSLAY